MLGKKAKIYKRGPDHADGELWLVSYADMMTLLFGFFVILVALSSIDEERFNSVGKQLAETFRGDIEEIKSKSEVGMLMQARQIRALQLLVAMLNLGESVEEAVDRIEKEVAEKKSFAAAREAIQEGIRSDEDIILSRLKTRTIDREDRVELAIPGGVLFHSGTANLTVLAKVGLKRIARYLNRVRDLVGLEIVGHTDSAPPSHRSLYPSNWALSSARAGAVAEELLRHGIPEKYLITRGMASLEPLFPEKKRNGKLIPENMSKNRRVHIIIKKNKNEE